MCEMNILHFSEKILVLIRRISKDRNSNKGMGADPFAEESWNAVYIGSKIQ